MQSEAGGPPDMELVDRRVAGHSAPLTDGFGGEFVDGQAFFDEAWCVSHWRVSAGGPAHGRAEGGGGSARGLAAAASD